MAGPIIQRFPVMALVSDLFYTLVDPDIHRPEGFTRAHKMAEALGLADADRFAGWWREMEAERHVNGSKKVTEYADEYLFEHAGRRCTSAELAEVDRIWGRFHDKALLEPEDEVLYALRTLRAKKVKLGLLSNIDERELVCWPRSPLSQLFDAVCMSCEIGYSKPSMEAYAAVLSKLGSDAPNSIYVGDGSHDELRGAKEAGFGLVVFMQGFISRHPIRDVNVMRRREEVADATISDLTELAAIVDRLRR